MIEVDKNRCDTCGTCISVCPENALALTDLLTVDPALCCECRKCVAVCPFAALLLSDKENRETAGG